MPYCDLLSEFEDFVTEEGYYFAAHRYFLYTDKRDDEPVCLAWQLVADRPEASLWAEQKNQPEPLLPDDSHTVTCIPHEQTAQFYPLLPHVAVHAEHLLRNIWNNELIEPGGRQLYFVSYQQTTSGTCFFAYYHCSTQALRRLVRFATETFDVEATWFTLTKPWASVEETFEALNATLYYIGESLGAARSTTSTE